ncbi:MAG: mechanosensitive ion channel [Eubacteriales bacterium]|nr:mechanosensitive ion channel [Eubacteriales bacterium]
MAKKLRGKTIAAFLMIVICVLLFGLFLIKMQTKLSVSNQQDNTMGKLDEMQAVIDNADAMAEQNRISYDEVYQSKAASVAYMANNDQSFKCSDAHLKELADMMNVSNILIIDKEGRQIARADKSSADFTYHRYNQLRTVFDTGEPSEAFEVTIDDTVRRYYAAMIDDEQEVVIEQDPEELHSLQEDTSSWKSILSKISVGLKGFTFAVSNQDYTFLYYPDEEMIGRDSLDAGLKAEDLADYNFAWMSINGEKFFCGVKNIPNDDAFVICAVPQEEINSARDVTVAIVLFIFFAVITIVAVYSILILKEQCQEEAVQVKVTDKLYYNKTVGRKILTFSGVGLILIIVVSFYMQTLFSLSMRSMSNNRQVQETGETLKKNDSDIELITAQYNRRYLNKCQVAAKILSENHQLWNKEDLAELSRAIGAEFLLIFDKTGREIVSDSTYTNFQISINPEDQSYEFGSLLQGREYYIQEAQPDQVSGTYRQYIGVLLQDEEGEADGFVQMCVVPEKLEEALQTTTLPSVLSGVKASAGGFAFAIDKETGNFSWFPDERVDGKNALEYGMKEKQLRDGYCDYITINSQKYFASSLETETNYIYVAVPQRKLMATRLPVALASGAASLACLILVFLLLAFGRKSNVQIEPQKQKEQASGPMVDVIMPDGSTKKSEAAANRWSDMGIQWHEKTPEQKLITILEALMSVLALAICVAILFKDRIFQEDSIFLHIIQGNWEHSLNVFALTGCIMIICVCGVAVMIVREILRLLARAMNAKGATICHLLRNFVKYISVIAMLYYCFALFGVDTQTLLASAGILSLVIGLGAKELVSDILAGLFIIFEGEFQVGDIVTVGDWRGIVQEIGVRTTKILSEGNNVKIISNSAVSGVINMTKNNSQCCCDLGIVNDRTLDEIESILTSELPQLKYKLPAVLAGPVYKGVYSLSGSTINIRLVTECNEADKAQLGRDLNREIKMICDRHGITLNSITHS